MQRLSYVNINYIYSIYSKFASILNDDMIYSNLTTLNETCNVLHSLLGKPMVCIFAHTKEGIFVELIALIYALENIYLSLF